MTLLKNPYYEGDTEGLSWEVTAALIKMVMAPEGDILQQMGEGELSK